MKICLTSFGFICMEAFFFRLYGKHGSLSFSNGVSICQRS